MKIISQDELSHYKILPFDLYDEDGQVILAAGEVLTVGKLLQLKAYEKMFQEEVIEEEVAPKEESTFSLKESARVEFDYDSIEPDEYDTPINKYSKIPEKEQVKLKIYLLKTLMLMKTEAIQDVFPKFTVLRDVILDVLIPKFDEIEHYSDLRLVGDYEICHPINVAVMAGMVAKKINMEKEDVSDIILAGILHDVGKYQILKTFSDSNITIQDLSQEDLKRHPVVGYNILKHELKLPENICKVALQHHEHNDGTGYPTGISGDWISEESKIINICNYFDNLACRKISNIPLKNNKDVIKTMLSIGSKIFSAKTLYTFVHMYSYNDTIDFDEMYS